MNPPETVWRLLAHVPVEKAAVATAGGLVIGRLLEEGESGDLRWLVSERGERELSRWVEERGGRQLSRRSRWFWEAVLGVEASAGAEVGEELWPL